MPQQTITHLNMLESMVESKANDARVSVTNLGNRLQVEMTISAQLRHKLEIVKGMMDDIIALEHPVNGIPAQTAIAIARAAKAEIG